MITIRDDGDHYTMEHDMDDNDAMTALAYAVADLHVDILPKLETGLDMTNAEDRAEVCRGAAVAFGALMAAIMDKMLSGEGGLQ